MIFPEAVIVGAARLPGGRFLGELSSLSAPQLGALAIRAALERSGVAPAEVDEAFVGNVVSAGLGQAPARQACLAAGLPPSVPATTINKVCGSGLRAVMFAAQAIRAGDGATYVAAGMESMSNAPYLLPQMRAGIRAGHVQTLDANLKDGLWCATEDQPMGMLAEHIAELYGVTRDEQDQYAYESHRRAIAAEQAGAFRDEIVPVAVSRRRGSPTIVSVDEPPRADCTIDALAQLPLAFRTPGTVTAGNAPGLSDGAAAVVVMERSAAERSGSTILGRIAGYASAALEPKLLFAAPPLAIRAVLERTGWSLSEVDLFEINEAFAAQVLANARELGWTFGDLLERVNVHGGAIALGHPIGASGTRVLVTLVNALRQRGQRRGIAALCLGGGGAVALAVEVE